MVATLYLISCILAPAQPPARTGERVLGPRLTKAQELVYRGVYSEESGDNNVRFSHSYRIENRIFVLDTLSTGADVALLTIFKSSDGRAGAVPAGVSNESAVNSARLELARVNLQGRITPGPGVNLTTPLDGPPTVECGVFVELPTSRVLADGTWSTEDADRPPRLWRNAGTENVNGNNCVKLIGEQHSEEWDKPRADRGAWRRIDTVWLAPGIGIGYRIERVIEHRSAGRLAVTHKNVLRYEMESSLQYPCPGQLYDDRRQEIAQARAFSEAITPLLPTPVQQAAQLNAILNRINYYLEHQAPTPYRAAILQLRHRIEAARRGEILTPVNSQEKPGAPSIAETGQTAPDFVATDLLNIEANPIRLRDLRGRPVLLAFYNSASPTAEEQLRFAQSIFSRFNGGVGVLALSVDDDAQIARKQHAAFSLGFPILNGSGLRISYAVETTPKFVLIDGSGVVRGIYLGWGGETPREVLTDLRLWAHKP